MGKDALAVTSTHFVIARSERSDRRGNPSCLEGVRTGLSLRLLDHGGSPGAFRPSAHGPVILPSSSLATAFGNQHGSRRWCYGSRGWCCRAQQNAGPSRRCTRNHPGDPIRARCRSARIRHRVAGGISRLVPVRGPFPDISVHIKKAPWVGGKLSDIHRLVRVRTMVPVRIRTGNCITP